MAHGSEKPLTRSEIFLEWAQIPGLTVKRYMEEQASLQRQKFPHVATLPGAEDLLCHLSRKGVPIALATSSTRTNYNLKSSNLGTLFDLFGPHIITGDDERVRGCGKPKPDIYLVSLAGLNEARKHLSQDEIRPDECLVLEDAIPGIESAKAAGMYVVWVPDTELLEQHKHEIKTILGDRSELLLSLSDLDLAQYGLA